VAVSKFGGDDDDHLVRALSMLRVAAQRGSEGWRRDAECLEMDTELFFPVGQTGEGWEETERAKSVCCGCMVRSECLAFALATNQQFGVWGGYDEEERRELRRMMRRRSAGRRMVG
jgi:WhiB family redox-sensing transcriptional regulator